MKTMSNKKIKINQKIKIVASYIYYMTSSCSINGDLLIYDDEIEREVGINKTFLCKYAKEITKELVTRCIGVNEANRTKDGFYIVLRLDYCGLND